MVWSRAAVPGICALHANSLSLIPNMGCLVPNMGRFTINCIRLYLDIGKGIWLVVVGFVVVFCLL